MNLNLKLKLKLLPFTLIIALYAEFLFSQGLTFFESQSIQQQDSYLEIFQEYRRDKASIDAPIIRQKPKLLNGCEVCSLAMLLQYSGVKVDKFTLAREIRKDKTPIARDRNRNIIKWGDPEVGFVGDITGRQIGYGVYTKPMLALLEEYLPGRAVDLTGQSFDTILKSIDKGRPVVVWVTIDFGMPHNLRTWKKDNKIIKATFSEHAVLLVGYDDNYCYVNNSYNGEKNQKVPRNTFIKSWDSMGKMAISYK